MAISLTITERRRKFRTANDRPGARAPAARVGAYFGELPPAAQRFAEFPTMPPPYNPSTIVECQMSLLSSFSIVLAAAGATGAPLTGPDSFPPVRVAVDSAKKEITLVAGPFTLPNMPPLPKDAMMDHGAAHDTPVQYFEWPIEGWFRGFRVDIADGNGKAVPRHVMHHMIMVNFDRRQLLYPAAERLMGAGTETDAEVSVPKTIGVPMSPGMKLGMYVAWHNDTGKDLEDVYLKLTLLWTPSNQNPPPVNAMPIYMDVNLTVGGTNTFDVPPGRSTKAYEFSVPVGGRLLGVGGHMHDYGVGVRLEDAESGKVLTQVKAKRAKDGKVAGMSRRLFGVSGEGLKLDANRRYRVVGEYDNPTGALLVRGAMAHMVGLFVPEDMGMWPKIDASNPDFQRDLASLQVRGNEDHGEMDHSQMDHGDADGQGESADNHEGHEN